MIALALAGSLPFTMTTREIAELTGKEHKHILRDARVLLIELGQGEAGYVQSWTDPQNGQGYTMLALPKRETLILVSGYSVRMRARIIDRWQELEAAVPMLPRTLSEALRLAADLADAKSRVEQQLAIAAPRAEAMDRLADADGLLNPTDAAKAMQVAPKRVFQYLRENGWTYRRAGGRSDIAYQSRIAAGLLKHKICVLPSSDGSERLREQVLITSKGLTKLAAALAAKVA